METLRKTQIYENIKMINIGSKKWMSRLNGIIEENIEDAFLDNKKIADELQISERQLFRKVKKITELTPQKYLKIQRLNQAMKILNEGKYRTVKETAHAVGYKKSNYFSLQFEKEFGKKPLTILRELGWR